MFAAYSTIFLTRFITVKRGPRRSLPSTIDFMTYPTARVKPESVGLERVGHCPTVTQYDWEKSEPQALQ